MWHAVGYAISELGKFAEALPWYECAVAAKERGDVHGRVDAESLASSLRALGDSHARLGKPAEAQRCFERAAAVTGKETKED